MRGNERENVIGCGIDVQEAIKTFLHHNVEESHATPDDHRELQPPSQCYCLLWFLYFLFLAAGGFSLGARSSFSFLGSFGTGTSCRMGLTLSPP